MVGRQSGVNGINTELVMYNKLSNTPSPVPSKNHNHLLDTADTDIILPVPSLIAPSASCQSTQLRCDSDCVTQSNETCHSPNLHICCQPHPSTQTASDTTGVCAIHLNVINGVISPDGLDCCRSKIAGGGYTTGSLPKGFTQHAVKVTADPVQNQSVLSDVMSRSLTLDNTVQSAASLLKRCHVNSVSDQSSSSSSFDV